jgi:antitoxin (DNA-binding transcriptional repressor) of toxin-antitoxin stability system
MAYYSIFGAVCSSPLKKRGSLLDQPGLPYHTGAMKTAQTAEAKTRFSAILKDVEVGNEAAIVYGRKKKAGAVMIPYEKREKNQKRQLGALENRMSVRFAVDFSMTDEELTNL